MEANSVHRRAFLTILGVSPVLGFTGCSSTDSGPAPAASTPQAPAASPSTGPGAAGTPPAVRSAPVIARAALPQPGTAVFQLPVDGPYMAWTVDDGVNSEVIRAYAEMAKTTGTRLMFFANGQYPGWAEHADLLKPMVQSGQIDIGNHTFTHAALTKLSNQGIIDELTRNDDHLTRLFGVSPKPFYRPPYGYRDHRTDAVAASIGYTTPVMWYGSLADSALLTEDQVVGNARQWFLANHIVIGHANYPPVTHVFPQLLQLLTERGLQTVTLRDVFKT